MIPYQADIAINAAYLVTMNDQNEVLSGATVLVKGNRIVYAGQALSAGAVKAKKIINSPDGVILPPFFNQHTHPSLSLYRGIGADLRLNDWLEKAIWPLEMEFSTPETVQLGTQLSLLEMIHSGTGALACMDYFNMEVGHVLESAGMRGYLGEAVFSNPTPCCLTPQEAFEYTRNLHQNCQDSDLLRVYVAIHAPFTSAPSLYEQAANLSNELKIMSTSHIAETQRERKWSLDQFGKTPVQLIESTGILSDRFVLIHGIHLDEKDIQILANHQVPLIHNPHSNMVLGSGVCKLPALKAAGVTIGLGTDSAASNNGLSMMKEMQTMSRLQKVFWRDASFLPAREALLMATRRGYEIYRYPELGQLQEGMLADLQIIDLNKIHSTPDEDPIASIVYSAHPEDTSHLMVNGKLLMENHKILTLDEELILKEVLKFSKKVSLFRKK